MGQVRQLRTVDAETGEVLAGTPVWFGAKVRSPYGRRWYMQSQEALEALAADKELAGRPTRVLLYLLSRLDFENFIAVPQADIGAALELHKANVSRSIRLLIAKGILIEGPRTGGALALRLNPNWGWKGKVRHLRAAQLPKKP